MWSNVRGTNPYVSIRQHTPAYASIRQHTWSNVRGTIQGRARRGVLAGSCSINASTCGCCSSFPGERERARERESECVCVRERERERERRCIKGSTSGCCAVSSCSDGEYTVANTSGQELRGELCDARRAIEDLTICLVSSADPLPPLVRRAEGSRFEFVQRVGAYLN
jgi:hypothetical protein